MLRGRRELERVKSRCDVKGGGESWKEVRVDVMLSPREQGSIGNR